jgi:hypothetical protein
MMSCLGFKIYGPELQDLSLAVYKLMSDSGFSKKPALKGIGSSAGKANTWAVINNFLDLFQT